MEIRLPYVDLVLDDVIPSIFSAGKKKYLSPLPPNLPFSHSTVLAWTTHGSIGEKRGDAGLREPRIVG